MHASVNKPANNPIAPPTISVVSLKTTPWATSAKGTIIRANANIIGHASIPLTSRNARQMAVAAIALKPTVDQMRDVSVSE